jgi:hypothetical protein
MKRRERRAATATRLALLRPGGLLCIGLHSERGRAMVVAARRLIAERALTRPHPESAAVGITAPPIALARCISFWCQRA